MNRIRDRNGKRRNLHIFYSTGLFLFLEHVWSLLSLFLLLLFEFLFIEPLVLRRLTRTISHRMNFKDCWLTGRHAGEQSSIPPLRQQQQQQKEKRKNKKKLSHSFFYICLFRFAHIILTVWKAELRVRFFLLFMICMCYLLFQHKLFIFTFKILQIKMEWAIKIKQLSEMRSHNWRFKMWRVLISSHWDI